MVHITKSKFDAMPVLPYRRPSNTRRTSSRNLEKQFSRLDEAVANLNRVKANLKRYNEQP